MHFRSLFPALLAVVLASLASGLPAAHAQSDALDDDPGFVSPHTIDSWFAAPPTVEVNLAGPLLDMAAAASEEKKPKAAALLNQLKGIYVRIFADSTATGAFEARATRLLDRLQTQGWQTVVRVREGGEHVNVQMKPRGADTIAGLVVLVNEPGGETVFVNIVGNISPAEVGRLGGSLDIDALEGLGGLGSASETASEDAGSERP